MPTLLEDLQSYQARRKFPNWQPKPAANTYTGDKTSPGYQVLLRCLDFLPLEMQVAEWDREALLVPEVENYEIESILERNAADETKHDTALRYLSNYLEWSGEHHKYIDEHTNLLHRWQTLNCHPLISMYSLEIGVFYSILPALLNSGDVYAATVAQWISDDEVVHVNTGRRLMTALGLKLTKEILTLVHDTNVYIFKPLGDEQAYGVADRAVRRTVSGRDNQMLQESLPTTIAFFEQRDKRSIVY